MANALPPPATPSGMAALTIDATSVYSNGFAAIDVPVTITANTDGAIDAEPVFSAHPSVGRPLRHFHDGGSRRVCVEQDHHPKALRLLAVHLQRHLTAH